jgi:hypothetical protein
VGERVERNDRWGWDRAECNEIGWKKEIEKE